MNEIFLIKNRVILNRNRYILIIYLFTLFNYKNISIINYTKLLKNKLVLNKNEI